MGQTQAEISRRYHERWPEKRREYYLKNKERIDQQHREYYAKNRGKVRAKHAQYNREHPELLKEIQRGWRNENPLKARAYTRKYRQANIEACREKDRISHKNKREHYRIKDRERRWANIDEFRRKQALYRDSHREKINERQRFLRANDPARYRGLAKKSRLKHVHKRRAECREWFRKNRGHATLTMRLLYNANPEKYRQYGHRHKALKKGAAGSFTVSEWLSKVEQLGWKCFYCAVPLTERTLTQDHMIPLIKGGSNFIDNLAPCCKSCNSRKGDKTVEDFKVYVSDLQ